VEIKAMLTKLAALVMYFKYDGALVMYIEALQQVKFNRGIEVW
jgi:hypothetical protein